MKVSCIGRRGTGQRNGLGPVVLFIFITSYSYTYFTY